MAGAKASEGEYQLLQAMKITGKDIDKNYKDLTDVLTAASSSLFRAMKQVAKSNDLTSFGCEGESEADRIEVAEELKLVLEAYFSVGGTKLEAAEAEKALKELTFIGKKPADGVSYASSFATMRSQTESGKGLKANFRAQFEKAVSTDTPIAKVLKDVKNASSRYGKGGEGAADDQDDIVLGTLSKEDKARQYTCPIGKSFMNAPTKNTTCNHVYDKVNIEALLVRSKKAPLHCPVVGCGKIVDPAKLIPDEIMRADIQQFIKISAKLREARRDDSDDEEDLPKPAPKKSRGAVAEDDDE